MNQRDPLVPTNDFLNFENFGNYILLKKLATGGMAEVFLARPASQQGNGRVQVIKRILPHVANDAQFRRMFQTEIQVCMAFNHPHTVQLHDFGDHNGQPYISMEYIEGKNLKEVITKFAGQGEMIPIPMALSLMSQAAAGIHYAHTFVNKVTGEEVKAIHRDISPHNLLVNYEGNLKVIDFGIAKAASGIQDATRAGTIKGKYAYLSPEQITSQPIDARSDIFALGIVAWELLTLRRPFSRSGDSDLTILGAISNCDHTVKAPSYYNGAVPPELDQVILKALRKNPSERYASADEFQAALRQVMQVHFPQYSYSENGKMMRSMFEDEIMEERKEIRLLNMNVQLSLNKSDATMVMGAQPPPVQAAQAGGIQVQMPAGMPNQLGVNTGTFSVTAHDINMDRRLRDIESVMKKKASAKHYALFAFYLFSIVVLKLDEAYPLFEFLLPQGRVAASTRNQPAQPVAQTAPVAQAPQQAARVQPQQQRPAQQQQPYYYQGAAQQARAVRLQQQAQQQRPVQAQPQARMPAGQPQRYVAAPARKVDANTARKPVQKRGALATQDEE